MTNKWLVRGWMFGFAVSAILQSAAQHVFASATSWGPNVGWQNEIAIWNVGLLVILARVQRSEEESRRALAGLGVLSAAFAANHLCATVSPETDGIPLGNLAGFASNAIAIAALVFARGRDRSRATQRVEDS